VSETECDRLEQRVLVLAPTSRDAELTASVLGEAGIECLCCQQLSEICRELDAGAGVVVLPEEAVVPAHHNPLAVWLASQPAWSEMPLLVLAQPGADSATLTEAMKRLVNVTVLERPIRITALVSAVHTALRARRRQYQIRSQMAERELTADLLRERVEDMQALMDMLPVAVFVAHDTNCGVITGNRAAAELLRMQPSDNFTRSARSDQRPAPFRVRKNGLEVPPAELPIQRAARGELVRSEPVELVFDDGKVIQTLVSASPLYHPDGQLRGAVATIADITEQKNAELALREADRRKDDFLAVLAHELRNPLAPIRNAVHILRRTGRSDAAAERVTGIMERQVSHMVRLVDDLLEISRITRGKIELRKEPVEVAAIVRSALETSRPHIESAGHQLSVHLPAEPIWLQGDADRLTQIIGNLLNNAAKYTDAGGQIVLTVRREDQVVSISVRDTGMGISQDLLPRVFEPFMQADRHPNRARGGLGIGLTLARNLVEMHGGSIRAYSDGAGRGSEFVVSLPLAVAQAMSQPAPSPQPPTALASQRILVVDDNRDAAESLGMLLKLLGADVRVAYDGPEALEAFAEYQPAVVLLDIGMPGMDGFEVARRLQQQPGSKDVTFIALTGWGQEGDRQRSRSAGFQYHLIKPADIHALETLLAALDSAPESRRAH
jgi:signal transduction histidine kinase/ActR/RegA family two-component response regulator